MRGLDRRDGDILSGAAIAAFAAVIYAQAAALPSGAASFPKGISIAVGLGGLLLVLRSLRLPKTGELVAAGYNWRLFFIATALWLVTVLLLGEVGFFVSTGVFMAVLSWLLAGRPLSLGSIVGTVAYAVGTSVVLWAIFVKILAVALPKGWLI